MHPNVIVGTDFIVDQHQKGVAVAGGSKIHYKHAGLRGDDLSLLVVFLHVANSKRQGPVLDGSVIHTVQRKCLADCCLAFLPIAWLRIDIEKLLSSSFFSLMYLQKSSSGCHCLCILASAANKNSSYAASCVHFVVLDFISHSSSCLDSFHSGALNGIIHECVKLI